MVLIARWIARHPEQVRGVVVRQLERPWVAAVLARYRSQLAFAANRFRPGNALGLVLTAQLAVLAASGWIFGVLVQDVVGGDGAILADRPTVQYLADHRSPWLTTTMRMLTHVGSIVVLIPVIVLVGAVAYRRTRSWAPLAQLALSLAGAVAIADLIKPLVGRPRPAIGPLVATASGYAFPSGHATQTAAVAVTLALLGAAVATSWPRRVGVWLAAVLVMLTVGFSRVYLGVHWPSDVVAGFALGALWAVLCALAMRAVGVRRPRPVAEAGSV